jgi:hypothetical protein
MSWTDDVEYILNKIRLNSIILSEYHRKDYLALNACIKYFKIPIIVISAVNSVFSVMLTKFCNQDVVTVLNSMLSLIVGVIGSIELFLGVQQKINADMSSSRNFYNLAIDIFNILSLQRNNRHVESLIYLDQKMTQYNKYIAESNIRSDYIKDNLFTLDQDINVELEMPQTPIAACL